MRKKLGSIGLAVGILVICGLPAMSVAGSTALDTKLRQTTQKLGSAVNQTLDRTEKLLTQTEKSLRSATGANRKAEQRQTTQTPLVDPPLHGTNPHGQGTVGVVDVNPSNQRPLGSDTAGSDSGEDVVIGRARGEKGADGNFRGRITILGLFGEELAGVDTNEGQTESGPLAGLQTSVLDPLCASSNGAVCLSLLTADSTTTANGSTNDFAVARAGVLGLNVGAAESNGTITEDANCQTSSGAARTANVATSQAVVAQVANSGATSKSCRNQAPQTASNSMVIGLFGAQVPLPAAGCANGTPDTVTGLPPLLPIVCNATDVAGAAVVREALDVFVLNAGGTSLLKETTAAAEAISVAPTGPENGGPECSDGVDNDGDGLIDAADPECHTDGNPNNPASYNPNDDNEANGGGGDDGDDGDRDTAGGGGAAQCSDNRDNDGDGLIDERDPGCHTDGNPNNPASYNPNDDDERDGGARTVDAGALPFTGADVLGIGLAGLLLLAGGLLMRRQEGRHRA